VNTYAFSVLFNSVIILEQSAKTIIEVHVAQKWTNILDVAPNEPGGGHIMPILK
jgi:hypothetical protein